MGESIICLMSKKKKWYYAGFIMSLLISASIFNTIQAQVTIGYGEKSNNGCILDLKEKESSNTVTANRGLNLPRVSLVKLEPTNQTEFSASIGGTSSWNLDKHVGLFVYNTQAGMDIPSGEAIYEGLYVWDVQNGNISATPAISTVLGKYYTFPESNTNTGSDWLDANNKVNGLLYSWYAATNSQNPRRQDEYETLLRSGLKCR